MNRSVRDFFVGLTVIAGLVGVALLLLFFGEFSGVRRETYPIRLQLADASGLTKASAVTLNGVSIGVIRGIEMTDPTNPASGVVLALEIVKPVRLPRNVSITLERGLVGEASLSMTAEALKPGEADPGFVAPGETFVTTASGFLEGIAGMIDQRMEAFTSAARSIEELAQTFTEVGKESRSLFEPRTVEDIDSKGQPANLPSTLARLDRAVKAAEAWLGDDAFRSDATQAASRLPRIMDDAASAINEWKATATTLDTQAKELGDEGRKAFRDFAQLTASLSEAILEVQTLVARVNRGEGTAGQLVTNPDLYNSINDAAVRLERALTEAQLLFEKYRKEGVPIRF